MLSEKMQAALNAQIKAELDSAYLYLSMAAHFEAVNLGGFAKWMRLQAKEEQGHAMRIFDFVVERGGRVVLEAVDKPQTDFGRPVEVFQQVLEHERKVTGLIHDLYAMAQSEKDYASQVMLHWFIEEQVEEESTAEGIVERLRLAGDAGAALLLLDRELGARSDD